MLKELTGFHMEKVFTETEFQTNHVCLGTVSYKTLMGVQLFIKSLEFSGAAKQILNWVRFKQTPTKKTVK